MLGWAHARSEGDDAEEQRCFSRHSIAALLMNYEAAVRSVYLSLVDLATVVAMAAQALGKGGHIYYLGRNSFGLAAVIDASECQPTYNARFDDVRAFLCGGYETLRNVQGDLSSHSSDFRLGWSHFLEDVAPTLTANDLVIVVDGAFTSPETPGALADEQLLPAILQQVKARSATLAAAIVGGVAHKTHHHRVYTACERDTVAAHAFGSSPVDKVLNDELRSASVFDFMLQVDLGHVAFDTIPLPVYAELAMKLVLNAITTGAFVLTGKVMSNRMIDLQVCRVLPHACVYACVRVCVCVCVYVCVRVCADKAQHTFAPPPLFLGLFVAGQQQQAVFPVAWHCARLWSSCER